MAIPDPSNIKIKIESYDEENLSVVIRFWCPELKKGIDDYFPMTVSLFDLPHLETYDNQDECVIEYLKDIVYGTLKTMLTEENTKTDREKIKELLVPNRVFDINIPSNDTFVNIFDVLETL